MWEWFLLVIFCPQPSQQFLSDVIFFFSFFFIFHLLFLFYPPPSSLFNLPFYPAIAIFQQLKKYWFLFILKHSALDPNTVLQILLLWIGVTFEPNERGSLFTLGFFPGEADLDVVCEACLPYLSCRQPIRLQEASLRWAHSCFPVDSDHPNLRQVVKKSFAATNPALMCTCCLIFTW